MLLYRLPAICPTRLPPKEKKGENDDARAKSRVRFRTEHLGPVGDVRVFADQAKTAEVTVKDL
jgi:hypothetical protein